MHDATLRILPRVPDASLPEAQLTAPLPVRSARLSSQDGRTPDSNSLSEMLEPLISAAIARKARQRRYTP